MDLLLLVRLSFNSKVVVFLSSIGIPIIGVVFAELDKQLLVFSISFNIYLVVSYCRTRCAIHCVPHLNNCCFVIFVGWGSCLDVPEPSLRVR
jgi:hypothetical protein